MSGVRASSSRTAPIRAPPSAPESELSTADFDPEPLEAPLNQKALASLKALETKYGDDRKLLEKLSKASEMLSAASASLTERAYERRTKYAKKLQRKRENDEDVDPEEQEEHDAFQAKVDELTKSTDSGVRRIVEDRVWLEELPAALKHMNAKAGAPQTQTTTQMTTQDGDEDEDEDRDVQRTPAAEETPSALLQAALSDQERNWRSKGPTEQYARDKDYERYYQAMWDAKNPGENAPPMPAPDFWFAEEEARDVAMLNHEDDELGVVSERLRIKCPITMLPFQDPVTAEKCKHSYERSAILEMFKTTQEQVPWTAEQQAELSQIASRHQRERREREIKIPRIRCPECATYLVEADLKSNLTLKRKVQRYLEAQREREAEDEDDGDSDDNDDDAPRGTQKQPLGLDSSPMPRPKTVKSERRRSGMPSTQTTTAEGATVMELGDDTDDMDEE